MIFCCDKSKKQVQGHVKVGYRSLDPSEGHMYCDVIVLELNCEQHEFIANKSDILYILPFDKNVNVLQYPGYFGKRCLHF